jgi:hypothetical protein
MQIEGFIKARLISYGETGLDILIAFGGIRMEGDILNLGLNGKGKMTWSKMPVKLE